LQIFGELDTIHIPLNYFLEDPLNILGTLFIHWIGESYPFEFLDNVRISVTFVFSGLYLIEIYAS
jgi:hypothetical protein